MNPRSQDVFEELAMLRDKKRDKSTTQIKNNVFLLITGDASIFNKSLPVSRLVSDIASFVTELHIIYIGREINLKPNFGENVYVYNAPYIPFLSFITVYRAILYDLLWQNHFLPTHIISLGDEVHIARIVAEKYSRPLSVFYGYTGVLRKEQVTLRELLKSYPQKIIVPNSYIEKIIKSRHLYKEKYTSIDVIPEYIDVNALQHVLHHDEVNHDEKNSVFTMITFPRHVNLNFFLKIWKIKREVLKSIKEVHFIVVVRMRYFIIAYIFKFIFPVPLTIYTKNTSYNELFNKSRLMLYFDYKKDLYEPILLSFVSGCPVLSSGDEYSKAILFNSSFEEFSHLERSGEVFGTAVRKLINDQYLYKKYKINCADFANAAFTHDHDMYIKLIRESLLSER
mgnify:CR=1 FL=1